MGKKKRLKTFDREGVLKRITEAGCKVRAFEAAKSDHWRVTGPKGGEVDLWPRRQSWLPTKGGGSSTKGITEMLAFLATYEGPHVTTEPTRNPSARNIDLTVFCDASFDHVRKIGTWGCWMKGYGLGALEGGGRLTVECETSALAELMAIAHALKLATTRGYLRRGSVVMIQSDCQGALAWIRHKLPEAVDSPAPGAGGISVHPARRLNKSVKATPHLNWIAELVYSENLKLVTRHIYGHTAGDGRNWCNRQADRIAAQFMKAAQAEGRA